MPMHEESGELCCSPIHGCGDLSPWLLEGKDAREIREAILASGQPQTTPAISTDALGLTWCEDCRHRGDLINWGKAHGWPALEIPPYAIARGAYHWHLTATQGTEDRVWVLLGLTEMVKEGVV